MASIKVALELDDSRYTQKMARATNAAEKFTKTAQDGATKTTTAFNGLTGSLDKLASGFEMRLVKPVG